MRVCKENDVGMVKKIHEISALFAIFQIQKPELGEGVLLSQKHQGEFPDCIFYVYVKCFGFCCVIFIQTSHQTNRVECHFLWCNREGKWGRDLKGNVVPLQVSDRAGSSSSAGGRASSLQTCPVVFGKAIKATSAFQGAVLWSALM